MSKNIKISITQFLNHGTVRNKKDENNFTISIQIWPVWVLPISMKTVFGLISEDFANLGFHGIPFWTPLSMHNDVAGSNFNEDFFLPDYYSGEVCAVTAITPRKS